MFRESPLKIRMAHKVHTHAGLMVHLCETIQEYCGLLSVSWAKNLQENTRVFIGKYWNASSVIANKKPRLRICGAIRCGRHCVCCQEIPHAHLFGSHHPASSATCPHFSHQLSSTTIFKPVVDKCQMDDIRVRWPQVQTADSDVFVR